MAGGMVVVPVMHRRAAFAVSHQLQEGWWGNQPPDERFSWQASLSWPSGAMLNRKGAVMPRHPLADAQQ